MDHEVAKKHFVLVHGSGHGAWCWYKLAALLEAAGHTVTAVDLGGSGIDPQSEKELRSMVDYVEPLMNVMAALPEGERVLIVGHSFGGISIAFAMQEFSAKIAAAVFASANVPAAGRPLSETMIEYSRRNQIESMLDCQISFDEGPENPPTFQFGPQYLATKLYQLCSLEDIKLATMLVRPCKSFVNQLSDSSFLTEERFGSVPKIFIRCTKDEIIKEDMQQWMIARASVNEVMEIESDHMVMLSKPHELFHCLIKVAEKYF